MGRSALALFAVAATALFAALPAAGKEGAEATLTTSIPLDAAEGTQLRVAWTLAPIDEDGRQRPFGAGGIFVRLLSATGASAETGYASGDRGVYSADVVVPKGGIGDVVVGLMGWRHDKTGTRRSDVLFPITDDPVPGVARVASAASGNRLPERADAASTAWVILLVAGSLSILIVLVVALLTRRNAAGARWSAIV